MTIKFNSTDEYEEELVKNAPNVHGKILRITKRAQFTSMSRRLFVTATHRVGDEIIRLDRYVGELVGSKIPDAPVYRQADAIMNALENTAKKLGIEVRAGMYDDKV